MSANECPDQKHLNNKVKQFTNEIRHKRINCRITHRFWATYRKVLPSRQVATSLDFAFSIRLAETQSRGHEIETIFIEYFTIRCPETVNDPKSLPHQRTVHRSVHHESASRPGESLISSSRDGYFSYQ